MSTKANIWLLVAVICTALCLAGPGQAVVEPHPAWVNSLRPLGVPGPELTLAVDGSTDYVVLVPAEPTGQDQKASEELARWLGEMTGAQFPILREGSEAAGTPVISVGRTKRLAAAKLSQKEADLGTEGIAIGVAGRDLYLWGGRLRGAINTVFVLLEEDLGCRWYTSEDAPVIPQRPTLVFRPVPRVHIPPLDLRDPFYGAALHPEWSLQNRTNSRNLEIPAEWGGYPKSVPGMVHTSRMYVTSGEFFTEHPEYFAMNAEGKRVPTQLCLTNPEVLRITIERGLKYLEENPDARFLDFSAEDRAGYCQCPACKALDEAEATDYGYGYGAHAGTTLSLVNALADAVAEKHPEVLVTTPAYLGTLQPTKNLRPRDNVRVVMTTSAHWGTVCRYVTESAAQADIMRGWNQVGAQLIVWHYPIVYGPGFGGPVLNLPVISGDMRFFINNGARGIMLQALDTYTRGVDRELLRCWVWAKQMWNPRLNTHELVRDFTYGFYGRAAHPMQAFFNFLERTWDDNHMEPSFQTGSFQDDVIFEPHFISSAMSCLDEAERLAGDDVNLRTRVRLAKVPIWYCQAKRGPVDGLEAYQALLQQMTDFATKEYGVPCLEWASATSFVADVNLWERIAEFDPEDNEFFCLGPEWEFRPDPEGQGVEERWFEPEHAPADWRSLRDDIVAGPNPHGLNELKGDVWFRVHFTVPEGFDSRTDYWMLLDAFDREETWLYIDGKLIMKKAALASKTYQWPCIVAAQSRRYDEARELLPPGTSHDLVLRVNYRDRADGRRWKPVTLISTNVGFQVEPQGTLGIYFAAVEEQRRRR